MNAVLRLEPTDPAVRDLMFRAIAESSGRVSDITIRCRKCGAALAYVGRTNVAGPLFSSRWMEPAPSPVATMIDGEPATERAFRRVVAGSVEYTGDTNTHDPVGGTALLVIPPNLTQDYPDLLVRCGDDGDAVLEAVEVLAMLRGETKPVVSVTFPRRAYARAEWTDDDVRRATELGALSEPRVTTRVTTLKPHAVPLDELRARLHPDERAT